MKPKHALLADTFRSYILSGEWPVNRIIPSELKLCETHSASRATIRKTLETLALDGLIERRKKKGTWVKAFAERPVSWQLKNEWVNYSNSEHMRGEILNTDAVFPDAFKPFFKEFGDSESISRIKLLRTIKSTPFAFANTFIPGKYIDRVVQDFEPVTNNYIYQILERITGRIVAEVQDTYDAILAVGEVADMLKVAPGTPIFYIYRALYDKEKNILQATELHGRPDIQKLKIIHVRESPAPGNR